MTRKAPPFLQNYWEQVQTQVAALETALGSLQHIYHESLTVGGDEGLEQLGATDQRSHRFIRDKCEAGATLEATEDLDTLLETLDLQRCMMIPLASPAVAARLQEWYTERATGSGTSTSPAGSTAPSRKTRLAC